MVVADAAVAAAAAHPLAAAGASLLTFWCLNQLMRTVLHKFQLQHKLKETWTSDESKLLQKLIFMEEDQMHGSKDVEKKAELS